MNVLRRYSMEKGDDKTKKDHSFYRRNKRSLLNALYIILVLVYLVYFGYSLHFRFGDEGSWRLAVCTVFAVSLILWNIIKKHQCIRSKPKLAITPKCLSLPRERAKNIIRWVLYAGVTIFIVVFIVVDVAIDHPWNLVSLSGIVIFTILTYIFSKDRSKVAWHTIFWGLALQFIFGLIIMRTAWGAGSVRWVGDRFTEFMSYSEDGSAFVFGDNYNEHTFAFKTMPSVVVFCAAIELLSHLGVVNFIVKNIGGFLGYCLTTTPAESINAAANIFLGSTGSAMVVKGYLETMDTSELFVVLTSGMASIGGAAIILFIEFGIPADAILAASVMSAPAALAASKLYFPSSGKSKEKKPIKMANTRNMFEALSNGTVVGVQLVVTVAAMIITFLAMMKFLNRTVEWFGDRAGVDNLTLEYLMSYILYPFAFVMGTRPEDCLLVGNLLGIKSLSDSGVAYISLSKIIDNSEIFADYTAIVNNTWRYTSEGILLDNINITLKEGIMSLSTST
ncbi:hypothetical protein ScPMuIL_015936 [Solemya velum]